MFVYLCITLLTELFDLAGGDIPVLVAVSALVESQTPADSTLPWSWITEHINHRYHRRHARELLLHVRTQEEREFLHRT